MHTYIYIYIHISIYIHIHTYIHIYNIYNDRNRTIFYLFNFFNKSFLNDVFCDNANQIVFTCWTHIGDIFP